MLTDQDVLLLKLALERELLTSGAYRQAVTAMRGAGPVGGVGRVLRQVGVTGERVGELAELVAAAAKNPEGIVLARCDLEDALVARAIERSKIVPEDRLTKAKSEQRQLALGGELVSLSEILVRRQALDLPVAVELRRRARERVATCPRCKRHFIVEPTKASDGRYRCRDCDQPLALGAGARSAIELSRGISPEKPAAPIEASQLVQYTPDQIALLKAARERGMAQEAERVAQARAAAGGPPPPRPSPAPAPAAPPRPTTARLTPSASVPHAAPPGGVSRATPQPTPASPPRSTPQPTGPRPVPLTPAAPSDGGVESSSASHNVGPEALAAAEGVQPRVDRETVLDSNVIDAAAADAMTRIATEKARAAEKLATPSAARWETVGEVSDEAPAAVATFGEYEILAEIARGGMGIVYKARRKGAAKLLALKVLISGTDATQEQVERFEREGENARTLKHPGIVRVYDAGRHEGYHYIAMEFVEGRTLEAILHEGALEARRAAKVIRDVARAVHHMHEKGIVHRDLKPGNIILNETDSPKLIDFGLAKSIDQQGKLTKSGAAIGTPYYMPPEQVKGDAARIGPASDVYSLGAILFETIVGDVPFRAENPIELYHKIASSELPLPSSLKAGLPDDLVTIVAKSMEKNPRDRYPKASDLADELDRFLDGKALTAKRAGTVARAVKRAHHYRPLLAVLVLAAVAVSLALALVLRKPPVEGEGSARALQVKGRNELLAKHPSAARGLFEAAIAFLPGDPALEVDLARALAAEGDRSGALGALERAVAKGLRDPADLELFELQVLAKEPRFVALRERLKQGR